MGRSSAPEPRSPGACRRFHPHPRKDPSYHPRFAPGAQTGHLLRLNNRPGHVPASKQAVPFLRDILDALRGRFSRRVALEVRMEAPFVPRGIRQLPTARACSDAIKVGYWTWLALQQIAAPCPRGQPVAAGVTGYATELVISQEHDLRLRAVLYREHGHHETRRNLQLDLATPDDGG